MAYIPHCLHRHFNFLREQEPAPDDKAERPTRLALTGEQRLMPADECVFGRMAQGIQSDDLSLMAERCHPNRNRLSVKDVLDLLASQALR